MRPALYSQINNEIEAVFFIDNVFRKDPKLYEKTIHVLKEYKEFFPSITTIQAEEITSPGEYVKSQIFQKFDGHDIPVRRNIFKRIKDNFKRTWFENSSFPEIPQNIGGITEFKKSYLSQFEHKLLYLPKSQRELLSKYVYFSISSTTKVKWLNLDGAPNEERYKQNLVKAINNGNKIDSALNLNEFYTALFNIDVDIIIIENSPFLNLQENRDFIFTHFNSIERPATSQLIILEADEAHQKPKTSEPFVQEKGLFIKEPIKTFKSSYITVGLLILGLMFFTYSYFANTINKPTLELKYFGDEVVQDPFNEGLLLTWLDKNGKAIFTETNDYKAKHLLNYIPEGSAKIQLSKGNYEVYPDEIPVTHLKTKTIRIVFYKTMRIPEVVADSIIRKNAQRWYSFILKDSAEVVVACESISNSFSPQIAVFADRLGKERLIPNDNIKGDKKMVEISGRLSSGKYYLKVRGYDKMTGSFKLTTNIR